MEKIKSTQYYSIDIAKIIMAVLVVAIHRPPFEKETFLFYFGGTIVGGLAVPFFFIASSFLLFSKIKENPGKSNEYVKKNLLRLIKLYVIWSVINLPCAFVRRFTGHYDEITVKLFIGEVVAYIKDFFLDSSFMQLWFLNTLIVSIFIVHLLSKKFSAKTILIISLLLCAVYKTFFLFPSQFPVMNSIINKIPALVSNVLNKGFVCVALGIYTANTKIINKKVSIILLSFSLIFFFGFSYYNYFYLKNELLMNIILTIFLFFIPYLIIQLCLNITLNYSPIYIYLRKISILIYFTHFLLMAEAFSYIAFLTGFEIFNQNWFRFIFDLCFAFGLSNLILFLSNKKAFRWLKNLY